MQKYKLHLWLLATSLLFAACGRDHTARKQLEELTRNSHENIQYDSIKQSLDQLKAQYPKDYDLQKDILRLMREIEQKEQVRNLAFCDSLLPVRQAEADAMKSFFVFEKTEYDSQGRYIDKSWNPSLESGFSGIKTSVTEDNDLVLTAVYRSAAPIRYNRVKVATPSGEYAQTQSIPFDGGAYYSFNDGNGTNYEIATFQKGRDNGVIRFIYMYAKEKIAMEYAGQKKSQTHVLSQKEKDALVRTTDFAILLREIAQLQKQKGKAENRIRYLQSKR